jgi:YfiR/HmsC-like
MLVRRPAAMPDCPKTDVWTIWRQLVLLLFAVMLPLPGGTQLASESQLKAAFLYNFTKFVEWPQESFPSTSSPLQVCLLGDNPFGSDLIHITEGKAVAGHPIQIQTINDGHLAQACQVLFISSSERMPAKTVLTELRTASILTIGDSKNFAEEGGMIGLLVEDDRVRFEVNLHAANQAHLKISSKLLTLAKAVFS